MKELVYKSEKGTPITNSLLVSKKFEKQHKDVLEAIRTLAENSADLPGIKNMFYETSLPDSYGRMQPAFIMNRDGFSLLVMGFTGRDALKFKLDFIEAFNKMEKLLTSGVPVSLPNFNNPAEAARAWAQEYEQKQIARQNVQILEGENELLTNEVKQLAPKAEYTDKVLQSTSTCTMTQVAKELGMSAIALEKKLHEKAIMFRQSGQWILYAKYQNKGYTKPRTFAYPNQKTGNYETNTATVWTEAGRKFIHSLFDSNSKIAQTAVV
ncbi:MAG: phage regulatory protein/antirepressor Ant, partial [Tannerella sp.]|nr:phage regulatory protein/antirepressor Ant [Tannerella sp.]